MPRSNVKELRERFKQSSEAAKPEERWNHPNNKHVFDNHPFFTQFEDLRKGKKVAERLQAEFSDLNMGISRALSVIRAEAPISEYVIVHLLMAEHRIKKAIQEEASARARSAVEKRHSKENGSREKREKIRAAWATGKYSSRDICAEQECAALGMSFSTARKALRNTPEPA